ncbi:MAG: amidohydrolase family protein [Anaerolineae bacterium]
MWCAMYCESPTLTVSLSRHMMTTQLKKSRQAEMGVTISEFPVTKKRRGAHGMKVIMGAPNAYRGRSTSQNLSAMDAIHEGLVDALATDYYPSAILHTAFKLAREGIMPLHESIKLASTNAADAMHLHDRGQISVGYSADLVLVHENGAYPRVRGTIRRGVPIYWDSHLATLTDLMQVFGFASETRM